MALFSRAENKKCCHRLVNGITHPAYLTQAEFFVQSKKKKGCCEWASNYMTHTDKKKTVTAPIHSS